MFARRSHEFISSHESIFLPLPTLFWYMLPFICWADNDRLTGLCIAYCKLRLTAIKLMRAFFFSNSSPAPNGEFTPHGLLQTATWGLHASSHMTHWLTRSISKYYIHCHRASLRVEVKVAQSGDSCHFEWWQTLSGLCMFVHLCKSYKWSTMIRSDQRYNIFSSVVYELPVRANRLSISVCVGEGSTVTLWSMY